MTPKTHSSDGATLAMEARGGRRLWRRFLEQRPDDVALLGLDARRISFGELRRRAAAVGGHTAVVRWAAANGASWPRRSHSAAAAAARRRF